jgi:hypothetical protein
MNCSICNSEIESDYNPEGCEGFEMCSECALEYMDYMD